jgi:hypothetical protein
MDMGPIKNLKGVQHVTGCLAALSRFIARLGERSLPLYKLMKKSNHFTWTPEAQVALDSLKNMLKSPPFLKAPTHEELMLSDNSGGQCSVGGQARRAQKVAESAMSCVLCQRGTLRLQDALLPDAKSCVRDLDDQAQALTLLRCAPHHGGVQVPARGGHPQPQGQREDRQVGARVLSSHKYSRTSWPSGRRFKLSRRQSSMRHGSCILMARS